MSKTNEPASGPPVGAVGWVDLTIEDAESLRAFYASVVGWKSEPVDMGGYSDYVMQEPENGEPRTGVCHKRGVNAGTPSCWLVYFVVADLERSVESSKELGGKLLVDRRKPGNFCVIEDPAGAICALYQKPD